MAIQGLRFVESWFERFPNLLVAAVSFLVLTVWTRFVLKKSILGRSSDLGLKDVPEPPAWPVIGHLHLLGQRPHEHLMKLARQYGPIMSLRLGAVRVIVASDAEMAEEFLKTQDAIWSSRPPTLLGEILMYNYSDQVFQPLNDVSRKMRKIYFSELLSTLKVENQKGQRHDSWMHMANSLLAAHRENKLVDVHTVVSTMNNYQVTKLIFGKRLSLESQGAKRTPAQIIHDLVNVDFLSLGECFPFLKWLDLDGVVGKLTKLHDEFDTYVTELLEEHHRLLREGGKEDDSTDFLSTLLLELDKEDGVRLTYNNIKCAIMDIYFATSETTSTLITFTIAEILRHPDIKQKLVMELDDVVGREQLVDESDLVNLPYLKMVIKESMRLHAPAPLLLPHHSTAPSVVAGYHIPANIMLLMNIYAIQRHPGLWEDPFTFKPERFLDTSIDVRGQHFQLLPFGSGRRQCPGMQAGLTITEIVLARLFHSFDISLPPGMKPQDLDMTEKTGAAISLATPLQAVMSPRLAPQLYVM